MKLDHIAIAVRDLEASVRDFADKLGLKLERIEEVESEGARVAFFDLGGAHLELVAPTNDQAAIARSIAKRGEGLHHLCFEVEALEPAIADLKTKGAQLVNETPTPGAGGSRVAFVHPKSMSGVLVELVEKPRSPC